MVRDWNRIEGKDPMDKDEDDWGGKLEFGFSENIFSNDAEDFFLCLKISAHSHILVLVE